ncbi:hypothetical protein [Sphingobacterium paludis]|uniref:Lipoprotein n=1 Tax=Sphingobacterium paludis TaxID=1476465 RepID=A0A4R7CQ83_9SPHI|nr:hypothetical protein [Sphingobacterium paludis]TDS05965.1 hypothetical protein B0I21_1198 [Sphingobacterium paludis]
MKLRPFSLCCIITVFAATSCSTNEAKNSDKASNPKLLNEKNVSKKIDVKSSSLRYTILTEEISKSGDKVLYEAKVILDESNVNQDNDLRVLAQGIHDSIVAKHQDRVGGNPNVFNIQIFSSLEHANSGLAQWIAKLTKARNDEFPTVATNPTPNQSDSEKNSLETMTGKTLDQRKKIGNEIIEGQDRALYLAEKKYPITLKSVDALNSKALEAQRIIARQNMDANYEYEQQLNDQFETALLKKHAITKDVLSKITNEGEDYNWPIPIKKSY